MRLLLKVMEMRAHEDDVTLRDAEDVEADVP